MDINQYKAKGVIDKKHLVSLVNYTEDEIYEILKRAKDICDRLSAGEKQNSLKNKNVYLITKSGFSRSRIAFETAVTKLVEFFGADTRNVRVAFNERVNIIFREYGRVAYHRHFKSAYSAFQFPYGQQRG